MRVSLNTTPADEDRDAQRVIEPRRAAIVLAAAQIVDPHEAVGLHQPMPRAPQQQDQLQPVQVRPRQAERRGHAAAAA